MSVDPQQSWTGFTRVAVQEPDAAGCWCRRARNLARQEAGGAGRVAFLVPARVKKFRLLFDAGRGTRAPTQIPLDAP